MNHRCGYRVGDHLFVLDISSELLPENELSNYAPFRADGCGQNEEALFTFTAVTGTPAAPETCQPTASFRDDNGMMDIWSTADGALTVRLATPAGRYCCLMEIAAGYNNASARISGTVAERHYAIDTALMLLYAFASADKATLLIHASAIESEGHGYVFLGKSGTGKSTHSGLWTRHIPDTRLLNDDNPVVRVINGVPLVYGSPWSGKTPCYINCCVPLKAIVRLHQAPCNHITQLDGIRKYAALLPSCSHIKWDRAMADAVHATVTTVANRIPFFSLDCRPDREAALLCKKATDKIIPLP